MFVHVDPCLGFLSTCCMFPCLCPKHSRGTSGPSFTTPGFGPTTRQFCAPPSFRRGAVHTSRDLVHGFSSILEAFLPSQTVQTLRPGRVSGSGLNSSAWHTESSGQLGPVSTVRTAGEEPLAQQGRLRAKLRPDEGAALRWPQGEGAQGAPRQEGG